MPDQITSAQNPSSANNLPLSNNLSAQKNLFLQRADLAIGYAVGMLMDIPTNDIDKARDLIVQMKAVKIEISKTNNWPDLQKAVSKIKDLYDRVRALVTVPKPAPVPEPSKAAIRIVAFDGDKFAYRLYTELGTNYNARALSAGKVVGEGGGTLFPSAAGEFNWSFFRTPNYNLVLNTSVEYKHQSTNAEISGEYNWYDLNRLFASTGVYGMSSGWLPSFALIGGYTSYVPDWPTQVETHSGFFMARAEEMLKFVGAEVEFMGNWDAEDLTDYSGDWVSNSVHKFKSGLVLSVDPVRVSGGYELTNSSTMSNLHGAYLSFLWRDGIVTAGVNFLLDEPDPGSYEINPGFYGLSAEFKSFVRPTHDRHWYGDTTVAIKYEPYSLVLFVQPGLMYARAGWRVELYPYLGIAIGTNFSTLPYGAWESVVGDPSNVPVFAKDAFVGIRMELSWGQGDEQEAENRDSDAKRALNNHTYHRLFGAPHGIGFTGLLEGGRLSSAFGEPNISKEIKECQDQAQ